jgi:hypothetical protein
MINGGEYYIVNGRYVHKPGAGEIAQQSWNTTYEPMWNQYGADMQRQLQTAYDRSLASAQAQMGYGLSTQGSGYGGVADATRLSLQNEAMSKQQDIAAQRDMELQKAYIQFMTTKDAQAFEMAKLYVQEDYAKKMAEMNQPSWWQSLASITGSMIGLFYNPTKSVTQAGSNTAGQYAAASNSYLPLSYSGGY